MVYASISTTFFCGIDLHAREMYLCIMDRTGKVLFHQNMPCTVEALKSALAPYLANISVGVESTFNWYWIGDACKQMNVPFYLGHALYMKAIHGGKNKNDKIDSRTIANLMRTQYFPKAYDYPETMRATRDILRRRTYYVRLRASAYAHIRNTFTQFGILNVSALDVKRKSTREALPKLLATHSCAADSVEQDLKGLETYDDIIDTLEKLGVANAKYHDQATYRLLQTIPGVGQILALVIMYEIHTIARFKSPQHFSSYCRLVKAQHISAGKSSGAGNSKIGNPYLKWAFSEIIGIAQQNSIPIKRCYEKIKAKFGNARAKSIIAHRFGVATYYMLKNGKGFDDKLFLSQCYGGDGEPGTQLDGKSGQNAKANPV